MNDTPPPSWHPVLVAPLRGLRWLLAGLTPAGVVAIFLALWGCLAIYNATFHLEHPLAFVLRQIIWLVLGLVGLALLSRTGATTVRRALPWVTAAAYAALWLVLHFGVRVNGMQGWFAWGNVFMQPAELAKPVYILSLAWVLERTQAWRHEFWRGFAPALACLIAWLLPLACEPDFGTALVYALTFAALYWTLGGRVRDLLLLAVGALPLIAAVLWWKPYVWHRFAGFFFPDRYAASFGWHVTQFQNTIANGGLTGQSWGKGVWSQTFLPLGYSDSVFATLAESIGFLGVLPLLLLLLAWVWHGCRAARRFPDVFRAATVLGMVTLLAVQSLIHLSVNLGLMPPTGITLPFISYGGSSLLSAFLMLGLAEGFCRPAPILNSTPLEDTVPS